jgi:hypothetical protein
MNVRNDDGFVVGFHGVGFDLNVWHPDDANMFRLLLNRYLFQLIFGLNEVKIKFELRTSFLSLAFYLNQELNHAIVYYSRMGKRYSV